MTQPRYKVKKGSETAHCCFEYTVIDTRAKPGEYANLAECFEKADADRIVAALNEQEDRK